MARIDGIGTVSVVGGFHGHQGEWFNGAYGYLKLLVPEAESPGHLQNSDRWVLQVFGCSEMDGAPRAVFPWRNVAAVLRGENGGPTGQIFDATKE